MVAVNINHWARPLVQGLSYGNFGKAVKAQVSLPFVLGRH